MNFEEKQVSSHAEEYLESIYRLENKTGFARTMELARHLGVVAGSITNTIQNLERKGLVIHEPYKGVKLTEDGRRIASNILRRHRLAERPNLNNVRNTSRNIKLCFSYDISANDSFHSSSDAIYSMCRYCRSVD